LAWALFFASPAMFATNILVARLAAGWLPPMALTFWRWAFTALLAGALVAGALRKSRADIRREWPAFLLLGAIGMSLCGAAAYLAGQHTTALNIGLIYAASPILMVVLARLFLNEALGALRVAGIVLALTGMAAIVGRGDLEALARMAFNRGDLWAVAGSMGWGVYSFLLKRIPSRLDVSSRFACLCAGGAVVAAPFAAAEGISGSVFPFSPPAIALLTLTVLVASYGAYLAYARLQHLSGVAFAGLTTYMVPLFAALYGWIFMGECLHNYHLAGALLVLMGVWLAGRTPR
jgi:drug/metabolite transporter (DMT)-like permease